MSKINKNESVESTEDSKEVQLKKKHGDITKMVFTIREKTLTGYLRSPKLLELESALSSVDKSPISSSVGLFRDCWVGGDQELYDMAEDAGLAIAINKQIQSIIPNVDVSSKVL